MNIETARQTWIDKHREMGHHPHAAPTIANPERWECKCDPDDWTAVWRILTIEQIQQKFAHLQKSKQRVRPPEPCRYGAGTCPTHRRAP